MEAMGVDVRRTRFENGLVLLSEEMHSAPVVALQVWIRVGSADEDAAVAGIAHLHEHMLFKGTRKRGVGEIARAVEAAGGEINAWTAFDQTVYHVVLAAHERTTGLDILSDAVRAPLFEPDELNREIEVVLEEIKRAHDAPARRASSALFALAYQVHPYRRPVLGSEDTVRSMTRDKILAFFQQYYRPENVTVVAVGDFDTEVLQGEVEAAFGDWCVPGTLPTKSRPREPAQKEARVHVLREDVQEGRIMAAWKTPSVCHEDIVALDALSVLLGHGDSSRLYVETRRRRQLVNDVYAYAYTPADPGLVLVGAGFKPEKGAAAFQSLLDQVFGIGHGRIGEEELDKAKVLLLSEAAYQRETVQGEARKLGFYEVVAGDHAFEREYRRRVKETTSEDLVRVARRYFGSAVSVVAQFPEDGPACQEDELRSIAESCFKKAKRRNGRGLRAQQRPTTIRRELPGGAVLLVREENAPVVAIRSAALGGQRCETRDNQGIGILFASMWGLATSELGAEALAQRVAKLGGSLGAFSGRNAVGLRAEFVGERAEAGLSLFCDALVKPAFKQGDFDREQAVLLQRIRNRADNPAGVVFDLFSEALYPTHPYGMRPTGTEESVLALGLEEVVQHREHLVAPSRLAVGVVGAVDADEVESVLTQALSATSPRPTPTFPVRDAPPTASVRTTRTMGKKQTHVIVGSMGTVVDDPDRFALEILTTVLSGQSGRLFLDLRDKQSLAYSVSSSNVEGLDPGHVLIHIGTSPDKVSAALSGIHRHLDALRTSVVSEAELARAKRYLIGTHAIDLQRCGARAMVMVLGELFGLGCDDYMQYPSQIEAVTADDVLRVAQRFLHPDRLVEATVGP